MSQKQSNLHYQAFQTLLKLKMHKKTLLYVINKRERTVYVSEYFKHTSGTFRENSHFEHNLNHI